MVKKIAYGVGLSILSMMLGSCEILSKEPKITELKYEICVGKDDCTTETSVNRFWGEVEDVKILPLPNNSAFKGLLLVKSQGCIGWYHQPQEKGYYWSEIAIMESTPVDLDDVTVKIVKTKTLSTQEKERYLSMAKANLRARKFQIPSFTNCDSEEQILSHNGLL